MKTTIEIPDELMKAVKLRAIAEDRKLKDMVSVLLEKGLAQEEASDLPASRRVVFPLVKAAHPALPEEEMTPDRLKDLLLQQEVDRALGRQ